MDSWEGQNGDPFSLHKYSYTGGNPVGFVDPSGYSMLPELAVVTRIVGSLAVLARPTIKSWMIGWVQDSLSDDGAYSLSSLGVYDTEDSLLLQEDIGLELTDFSGNVFGDAAAHLFGTAATGGFTPAGITAGSPAAQNVMGMMQAGPGTAMGLSAFRKAKPSCTGRGGVYVLIDIATDMVIKTGRTKDFKNRESQLRRRNDLPAHRLEPVYRTDSYSEQRGLEETLYGKQGIPAKFDKIRPISPKNPNASKYRKAAERYIKGCK